MRAPKSPRSSKLASVRRRCGKGRKTKPPGRDELGWQTSLCQTHPGRRHGCCGRWPAAAGAPVARCTATHSRWRSSGGRGARRHVCTHGAPLPQWPTHADTASLAYCVSRHDQFYLWTRPAQNSADWKVCDGKIAASSWAWRGVPCRHTKREKLARDIESVLRFPPSLTKSMRQL